MPWNDLGTLAADETFLKNFYFNMLTNQVSMKPFSILASLRLAVLVLSIVCVSSATLRADQVIDFEDVVLPASGFINGGESGTSNVTPLTSGGASFSNGYSTDFGGFWSGFGFSNVQDNTTPGVVNQYASYSGGGALIGGGLDPGGTYAIANPGFLAPAVINLAAGSDPLSIAMNNTTYAGIAMDTGNDGNPMPFVSGAFGSGQGDLDPSGNDFLRITFTGYDSPDAMGGTTGALTRYLADFRADKSDNVDALLFGGNDYILEDFLTVDLTSLGSARSIGLTFEGTDVGGFGLNTPSYVALDNLTVTAIPEPGSLVLLSGLAAVGVLRRRRR